MDLDTLIAEADPARRVPLAGPDSAEATSLYREIIAGRAAERRIIGWRPAGWRRLAGWRAGQWRVAGWRGTTGRRRPWAPSPFVVALAAMVLAAAGAAAAVILGGGPAAGPGAPGGPAHPAGGSAGQPPGLLLAAAVASPPPAGLAEAGRPPYYVTLAGVRPVADVRGSGTGQILATAALPHWLDPKLTKVAAAAGHRRFVLAIGSARQTRFYQLRVAAGGHAARLTKLAVPPLPAGQFADSITVSADGSKLAIAIQRPAESRANPGSYAEHGAVEIVSLATGTARAWTTAEAGLPWDLSWANGGRELAFRWEDSGPSGGSVLTSKSGLWLLDTAAPGHSLLAGRRITRISEGGDTIQSAVLTPDGSTVIAAVTYDGKGHIGRGTVIGGIVELSARTGRPLRTLLAERAAHSPDAGWYIGSCEIDSVDTTAQHLLVNCNSFGGLDHGRFTALPGYPPQTSSPAAW
jgi:hypothetical protein